MARITSDPTADRMPTRQMIAWALPDDSMPFEVDAALQKAEAAWQLQYDATVAAWNAQCEADKVEAAAAERAAGEERQRLQEIQHAAIREAKDAARAAAEAKRPKFKFHPLATPPTSVITVRE